LTDLPKEEKTGEEEELQVEILFPAVLELLKLLDLLFLN
jgi:hypothetical protein